VVLLTGAAGFVGFQVLVALLDRGVVVRAVVRRGGGDDLRRLVAMRADRNTLAGRPAEASEDRNCDVQAEDATGRRPPESDGSGSPLSPSGLEIVETADLFAESATGLAQLVEGVDTIIHTAWYAEPGSYLVSPRNLDCLRGTLDLARAFCEAGGRRFVGVGSCFEYDLSAGWLPVSTPLAPATPYAACKAAAFLALSAHFERSETAFAWCRLFYLHGEGERPGRLVPYLHARLSSGEPAELTSGTQIRDYLNVRVAGARLAAIALGSEIGAINVCSGAPVTVREIAEAVADRYGARHLLHWGARAGNLTDPPVVVGVPGGVGDQPASPAPGHLTRVIAPAPSERGAAVPSRVSP